MLSFSVRSFHLEGNYPARSPTPFSIARGSLFVQKEISSDEKEFASNERVSSDNETVSEATALGNSTIRDPTLNKVIFNSSSSVVSIPTHSPTSSVSTTSSSSILSHGGLFGSVSPSSDTIVIPTFSSPSDTASPSLTLPSPTSISPTSPSPIFPSVSSGAIEENQEYLHKKQEHDEVSISSHTSVSYSRRHRASAERSYYNDIYINTRNSHKQARKGEWYFQQYHRIKYYEGSHIDTTPRNRTTIPETTEFDFTVISQTT